MPPVFREHGFKFEAEAPEHIEQDVMGRERDPSKFAVLAEVSLGRDWRDGSSGQFFPIATDIDDLPTARAIAVARERYLQSVQFANDHQFPQHVRILPPTDFLDRIP